MSNANWLNFRFDIPIGRNHFYLFLSLASSLGIWMLVVTSLDSHTSKQLLRLNESTVVATGEDEIDDEVTSTAPTNKTQNCSLSLAEFVIYFYVQTIICFIGFVLNLVNLAVFRRPQFSGAAYTYMTAMSVADAMTLLNYMPVGLLRCTGYFPYCQNASFKAFRTAVFYYNAYVTFAVNNMSEAASVWFTVLLSIERYMAMRHLGVSFRVRKKRSPACCEKPTSVMFSQDYNSDVLEQQINMDMTTLKQSSDQNSRDNRAWNLGRRIQRMWHGTKQTYYRSSCPRCRPRIPVSFRKLDVRYSIIAVTVLSIVLNVPFFFAQAVKDVSHSTSPVMVNSTMRNDTAPTNQNQTTSTSLTGEYPTNTPPPSTSSKLRIEMTQFGQSEFYKAFTWFKIILVQILPLVFLCIANFRLFQFIHLAGHRRQQVLAGIPADSYDRTNRQTHKRKLVGKHKQNVRNPMVNGGSSSRWQTAQLKLTILLIVIVALFVAGQIPQSFAYVEIYNAFIRPLHNSCSPLYCCRPYQIYRAVANTSCLFTYAVNFFVYLILNKHFRKQLRVWLRPVCPCCIHTSIKPPHRPRTSLSTTQHPVRKGSQTMPANMFVPSNCSRVSRGLSYQLDPMDYPSEAVSAPVAYGILQDYVSTSHQSNPDEKRACSYLFRTLRHTCLPNRPLRSITYQTNCSNTNGNHRLNTTRVQSEQPIQHRNYLTEIQFVSGRKPFISKSYKACYSYDSILKKVVVERDLCLHYATSSGLDPNSSSTKTAHSQGQYASLTHSSKTFIKFDSHQGPATKGHSLTQIGPGPNNVCETRESVSSPAFTAFPAFPTDSYSSCSHLFSPIAYQESDFDVISVDESLDLDQKAYNSAV